MTVDELIYEIEIKQMKDGIFKFLIIENFKKFGKKKYYLDGLSFTLEDSTLFCIDEGEKIYEQNYALSSILMKNIVDIIKYDYGYEIIIYDGSIKIEFQNN